MVLYVLREPLFISNKLCVLNLDSWFGVLSNKFIIFDIPLLYYYINLRSSIIFWVFFWKCISYSRYFYYFYIKSFGFSFTFHCFWTTPWWSSWDFCNFINDFITNRTTCCFVIFRITFFEAVLVLLLQFF